MVTTTRLRPAALTAAVALALGVPALAAAQSAPMQPGSANERAMVQSVRPRRAGFMGVVDPSEGEIRGREVS